MASKKDDNTYTPKWNETNETKEREIKPHIIDEMKRLNATPMSVKVIPSNELSVSISFLFLDNLINFSSLLLNNLLIYFVHACFNDKIFYE